MRADEAYISQNAKPALRKICIYLSDYWGLENASIWGKLLGIESAGTESREPIKKLLYIYSIDRRKCIQTVVILIPFCASRGLSKVKAKYNRIWWFIGWIAFYEQHQPWIVLTLVPNGFGCHDLQFADWKTASCACVSSHSLIRLENKTRILSVWLKRSKYWLNFACGQW